MNLTTNHCLTEYFCQKLKKNFSSRIKFSSVWAVITCHVISNCFFRFQISSIKLTHRHLETRWACFSSFWLHKVAYSHMRCNSSCISKSVQSRDVHNTDHQLWSDVAYNLWIAQLVSTTKHFKSYLGLPVASVLKCDLRTVLQQLKRFRLSQSVVN